MDTFKLHSRVIRLIIISPLGGVFRNVTPNIHEYFMKILSENQRSSSYVRQPFIGYANCSDYQWGEGRDSRGVTKRSVPPLNRIKILTIRFPKPTVSTSGVMYQPESLIKTNDDRFIKIIVNIVLVTRKCTLLDVLEVLFFFFIKLFECYLQWVPN